jgi:4-diphosphocytidyl-2-C-methyl-D-erythritol kinase
VRLAVRAPAKINLHLQVLGRRPDGYHELRTLLQSVDLLDDLTAETAPDGVLRLEVAPPGAITDGEDNLVLRSARLLWQRVRRQPGAVIRLEKRIPVAAGLGGGSADAAAALVLLDRLWSLGLERPVLGELAAALGSDVPFFLHGGLGLGVGRGDEVYPLPDQRELGVILASAGDAISTADVYRLLPPQLTWSRPDATVDAFAAGVAERPRWETMVNDLEDVVVRGWPVVGQVLAELRSTAPLRAAVTGSGGCVFALYPDRTSAEGAAAAVGGRWWSHVGVTLDRNRARPLVELLEEGSR